MRSSMSIARSPTGAAGTFAKSTRHPVADFEAVDLEGDFEDDLDVDGVVDEALVLERSKLEKRFRCGIGRFVMVAVQSWLTSIQCDKQKTRRQATQAVAAGSRTLHDGRAHMGFAR